MKRNVECLLTLNRMQEQTTTSLNLLETNNIGTYTYSPCSLLKLVEMLEGIEPTISTIPLGNNNEIVSGDQPSTVSGDQT